ncbi:MAG: HAD-IA family hydrolase [Acidimicrobiaceae bacterium]|nr:HAD-IA family hydrolase [Acidimicrobiaceae bacterium]
MTHRRYDVLLLDFGGVCLLNPVELHHVTENRLGLPPGSLTWMGPLDPSTDPAWRAMIAGNGLTERDYWTNRAAELGDLAGIELSLTAYMRLMFDPPRSELVRPGAAAVAGRARAAGIGVSVLSNDLRAFHGREWERGVEFLQDVDHIIDCSDTNVFKPDPRAYERAIEIVSAPPERVLFVDDQPLNVEAAIGAGLDGRWFDIANARQAWRDIAVTLGLEP